MADPSKFSLKDQVAMVTGSGQGIGRAIALTFAEFGAHLVIADINPKTAAAVAEEVRKLDRKALPVVADVTRSQDVARMVETAVKEFGRIDILVNNAGGTLPMMPLINMTEEQWDHTMNLDLKSAFLCSKAVARVMMNQKRGNIINISSAAGHRGTSPGKGAYSVAKGGMLNLGYNLAIELAPYRIRVNNIAPGPIETPLGTAYRGSSEDSVRVHKILVGRIGYPDDVALAAVYLASEASGYVTGATLDVKGGPETRAGDIDVFTSRFPSF
ncbi:MAG: SDR family NAD(P)-dependent oxidoreductase [Chloroflexota bacterium]